MGFGIGDRILFNIHQKYCIYVAVFQCALSEGGNVLCFQTVDMHDTLS